MKSITYFSERKAEVNYASFKSFISKLRISLSPFDKNVKRVTTQTTQTRNKLMIDLANEITVGFASAGGQLETLLQGVTKPINRIV